MAANSQSYATSFKKELMQALHNFGNTVTRATSAADNLGAALYYANNGMGATTTSYTASGEVGGTGYSAGGTTVTNATGPNTSGTTAYWTPSANITWTGLTIASAFDCCLIYNSSQANRAICTLTFAPQTISAGTFSITMPANGPTSALFQFN